MGAGPDGASFNGGRVEEKSDEKERAKGYDVGGLGEEAPEKRGCVGRSLGDVLVPESVWERQGNARRKWDRKVEEE